MLVFDRGRGQIVRFKGMEQLDVRFRIFNRTRCSTVAVQARVAGTSGQRRRGLSGVTSLEEGGGLWIVPCEAIHTFGMKIPIDYIFLDKALRVRKLRSNLAPRRLAICAVAHSVLELPVGAIELSGTALGDQLQMESTVAS